MPAVHRQFDKNAQGAPITKVIQSSVYANRMLVSVNGSLVKGHGVGPHFSPKTANGSKNVFVENLPVNKSGDKDTCGHPRALGSSSVYVNGG